MGKWEWECEPHGQRCETGGTRETGEASMGQVGQVRQVRQMRAIVGCEYMLGLTKQLFRDIPDYSEKNKSLCIR